MPSREGQNAPPMSALDLVEQEAGPLYHVASRICRNRDEAEELVQEVFVEALRSWEGFRGESTPATWLFRIAARHCRKMHRKRSGEPEAVASLDELLPCGEARVAQIGGEADEQVQAVLFTEAVQRVEAELAALDVSFRMPLLLKDVVGLSVAEIAEVLEMEVDTVRSRVHGARMKLRDAVDEGLPPRPSVPPPTPYSRQTCLDLLNAKQAAMDRGVAFDSTIICERCQVVFDTLDLTQQACRALSQNELPPGLREALRERVRSETT